MRTPRAAALIAMSVLLSACAGSKPAQPTGAAPVPPGPSAPAAPPSPSVPAPAPPPSTPVAEPPKPLPPPAPVPAPERAQRILRIKTDLANLREGPGTKAKILRVLRKGTAVTVLEERDQWYRVRLDDGREGWVAGSVTAE